MNLEIYFNDAMSYDDYIKLLDKNRTLHDLHYKKFYADSRIDQEEFIKETFNILVITEPWCGDSLALLPIIQKLSERNPTWEIRILLRDKNPELMNHFLTRDVRSIPIFLFLDERFNLITRWGPRPEAAQQIYEDHRTQIESGQITKQDVIKKIRTFYAKDRGQSSLEELKVILKKVLVEK